MSKKCFMEYEKDLDRAKATTQLLKKSLKKLKSDKPKDLDEVFQENHENVFNEIDCLECANCCKTTSPIFIKTDIDRLSRKLKMKSVEFINEYLKIDEDNDYVLKNSPCSFLMQDNKCLVYEDRPKACREYPHTNRKKMHQILNLAHRNTAVCPAVVRIVENVVKKYF